MALLIVKRWIMIQYDSAGSRTAAEKGNMCVDIETRSWVLDAGYEKHDVGNF